MNREVVLLVEEDHTETKQQLDLNTGQVRRVDTSAKDLCHKLGIRYRPMSPQVKSLVLYERKGKNGDAKPVTLGDMAPCCLVKVVDGEISNKFLGHDLGKPLRLSLETLRELSAIFGGTGAAPPVAGQPGRPEQPKVS